MSQPLAVAVVGATGALGSEVLSLLADSSLEVGRLLPIASEASAGHAIEFRGEEYAVASGSPSLRGIDLVFLCAPPAVALDALRDALHAQVPCIDASGTLSVRPEVTPSVACFDPALGEFAPLRAAPPGVALALALALRPLEDLAPLVRVRAICLEAASSAGRRGIESLYDETVALFNQQDPPEPTVFARPVAFDCLPSAEAGGGAAGEGGREAAFAAALARLLHSPARIALDCLQVPAFVGLAASVQIESARAGDLPALEAALRAAPGVEYWPAAGEILTLRAGAGREEVLIGHLQRDPACDEGARFWLVADVLRLAASNALRLAVARFGRHH